MRIAAFLVLLTSLLITGCGGGGGGDTKDVINTYASLHVTIDGKTNPQVVIADGAHYIFEVDVSNGGTADARQAYVKAEVMEMDWDGKVTSTTTIATGYIDVPKGQKITLKTMNIIVSGVPYFDVKVSVYHAGVTSTATTNGTVLLSNG